MVEPTVKFLTIVLMLFRKLMLFTPPSSALVLHFPVSLLDGHPP